MAQLTNSSSPAATSNTAHIPRFGDHTATVSLAKRWTWTISPSEALLWFFDSREQLHAALGHEDGRAIDAVCVAMRAMKLAAAAYEILAGRDLAAEAAIDAAFENRAINAGCWRRDGETVWQDFAELFFNFDDDEA